MLEGVDRPVAKVMMANLDLRHLMGIPASATRGRGRKAPLLPFYEDIKAQHPTKVLLVRVRAMPLLLPQECLTRSHAHLERMIARQFALALLSAPPPPHQCHSGLARCWQLCAHCAVVDSCVPQTRVISGKTGQVFLIHKASCASRAVLRTGGGVL